MGAVSPTWTTLIAVAALAALLACGPGVPPSRPDCAASTCATMSVACGTVPDGCGGELDCGTCAQGQACGAGGTNACGVIPAVCEPTTCEAAGKNCGTIPNGCGGELDCGACPIGLTCSGGGTANVCGAPEAPPCQPTTCAAAGATCGEIPDGCGGALQCGGCPQGQTCGGGGTANACGTASPPPCLPTTCAAQGASCGTIPDGCGGALQCGGCPQGQTCGGGGTANACGTASPPPCLPTTCAAQGATCGTIPDGCGGALQCGGCPAGQTCGGGGIPNACGAPVPPPCEPTTCAAAGATCGTIPDGCGGTLECGSCPEGQTCGGGGTANACGAPPPPPCEPTTCTAAGATCGTIPDGCSGTLECGSCPEGQTCGGGGTANACGAPPPPPCEPTTCAAEGATCGTIPDGCSSTLDCGSCPEGLTCAPATPQVCVGGP